MTKKVFVCCWSRLYIKRLQQQTGIAHSLTLLSEVRFYCQCGAASLAARCRRADSQVPPR